MTKLKTRSNFGWWLLAVASRPGLVICAKSQEGSFFILSICLRKKEFEGEDGGARYFDFTQTDRGRHIVIVICCTYKVQDKCHKTIMWVQMRDLGEESILDTSRFG